MRATPNCSQAPALLPRVGFEVVRAQTYLDFGYESFLDAIWISCRRMISVFPVTHDDLVALVLRGLDLIFGLIR